MKEKTKDRIEIGVLIGVVLFILYGFGVNLYDLGYLKGSAPTAEKASTFKDSVVLDQDTSIDDIKEHTFRVDSYVWVRLNGESVGQIAASKYTTGIKAEDVPKVRELHKKELQPAIDEAKRYISDPVFRQRMAEMKAER